ncbi:MAG TPA: CPBP family glutamic-type intramembrane protease [Caulobacteraceae bacterium]|nr:CPBP family glutamic-type intramembrane protease [Caulobacteraceae bacterium]
MIALARRRPALAYYLLALILVSLVIVFALAWTLAVNPAAPGVVGAAVTAIYKGPGYINILTLAGQALSKPLLLTVFAYAIAPTVAALTVAATGAGGGLKRLLARLAPVGADGGARRGGRALRLYLGLLVVYGFGIWLYDFVAGPGVDATVRLAGFGVPAALGALIGLFLDEGGTLEELGWRGFLWPNLRDRMRNPVAAVLLLGVLHWAWHLPREVFTILSGAPIAPFLLGQGVFLLLCLALAIVACWCVNQAGGSIWPAVFVHGGSNVWSKAMGEFAAPSFGFVDLRFLILAIAAIVILIAGRKGLARPAA